MTALALDVPNLVDLCRTQDPEMVANTREEAMRRAEYMRGRNRGHVVAALLAARVVEWEMAHRWPAKQGASRQDDRPLLTGAEEANALAWNRIYAVGAQDFEWITSRTEPEDLSQAAIIRGPYFNNPPVSTEGAAEWGTPSRYVEAAREVMGSIDTDPASNAVHQLTVQAATWYDAETDGLRQQWHGNVWLNPPYSSALIAAFTDRVVDHAGQWTALTNNSTDTGWGQRLLIACNAVCFLDHRVRFLNQENQPQGPAKQGQMVTYRGPHVDRFADVFGGLGIVL